MLTTNYVWTDKAQAFAEARGLETRAAGTVANFAYRPLENSPITVRTWLEDGMIEKVAKPLPFLNFHSKRDEDYRYVDMVKFLKENGIPFQYTDFLKSQVKAAIITDELVPITFHNICGNLYMITEKDVPLDLLFSAADDNRKEERYD